jgi:hypothetical protein
MAASANANNHADLENFMCFSSELGWNPYGTQSRGITVMRAAERMSLRGRSNSEDTRWLANQLAETRPPPVFRCF